MEQVPFYSHFTERQAIQHAFLFKVTQREKCGVCAWVQLSLSPAVDHWTFPELTAFPQFSEGSFTNLPPLSPHLPGLTCRPPLLQKYPQPPGRPQKRAMKYGLGGITTFALVFLMWFPLVFMSLVKMVGGVTNQPLQVSVKIAINGYEVSGGEGRERVPVLGRRKGMGWHLLPCSASCGPWCGFRSQTPASEPSSWFFSPCVPFPSSSPAGFTREEI